MTKQLNDWLAFIQLPRPELSGFAICPYAKQAILQKSYDVINVDIDSIHGVLEDIEFTKNDVVILIFDDYESYDIEYLIDYTKQLNEQYKSKDIVVLDNDPRDLMIVNGVTTSYEHGYLWIVQSLNDLNKKSSMLQKTNYYSYWSKKQLDEVVTWRNK
jgi:hypothetical protein